MSQYIKFKATLKSAELEEVRKNGLVITDPDEREKKRLYYEQQLLQLKPELKQFLRITSHTLLSYGDDKQMATTFYVLALSEVYVKIKKALKTRDLLTMYVCYLEYEAGMKGFAKLTSNKQNS
jgi:hypothetical protein